MFKASVRTKITLLLLLLCARVSAQSNNVVLDSIVKHAAYYHTKNSDARMFVHLDKTIYVPNDVIWFSAYLLSVGPKDVAAHEVLFTALVNDNDQKVAVQDKYVMGMGFAHGNIAIPDTIPPGNYSFIAYTNRTLAGKPQVCFVQPVTLKTVAVQPFNVELTLDTLYKNPINVRVLLMATSKNAPLSNATINYYLGKDKKTRIAGKAQTNIIGSYTFLLPKDYLTPADHDLEVVIKSGEDTKTLHLNIPQKNIPDVKFYPEGGHLIEGLPNRVGWEVKTAGGGTIKTSAVLYADKKPVDTIATDSYGMGIFYINVAAGAKYTVKLLNANTDNTIYPLPTALPDGLVLRMRDALVKDTLKLQLINKYSAKYYLVVHNYKQVFSNTLLNTNLQGASVKIAITNIPRGLATITVLDSLQRPCAERLFFAHYDQKPKLGITVDKTGPGTRQKINVKLKLSGTNGLPAGGVVSVACVQDNRFTIKNDNNIEHYFYLQSELDNLPLKDDLLGAAEQDHQYLNNLLLVRGWSKYKWQDMMKTTVADTIINYKDMVYDGNVFRDGKPLKASIDLVMVREAALHIVPTNNAGLFKLDNRDIVTSYGKKIWLQVSGKYIAGYTLNLNDPYQTMNKELFNNLPGTKNIDAGVVFDTRDEALKGFEHARSLKEVKVTQLREVLITSRTDFTLRKNDCGDYVCQYGWLNCPVHINAEENTAPIVGESYMIYPIRKMVPYKGCVGLAVAPGANSLNGVFQEKEFYPADYTIIDALEPAYYSTIYWKSALTIDAKGEADISFSTSDVTGKFRIVVQGVTNEDVVYGEGSFIVKK